MKALVDVAVIGGGATGTFFVIEAQRRQPHWNVVWIAPDDHPGSAYSSPCDGHLLNVPADRMGAWADQPGHFHDWLASGQNAGRFAPTDFVPRRLYGDYLLALRRAACVSDRVGRVQTSVIRAQEQEISGEIVWQLDCSDGQRRFARRVVCALGLPDDGSERVADPTFIRDPWEWLRGLPRGWQAPEADRSVWVLGSGLTAMDMVIALRELGFQGGIRVMSRSGRWSAVHERVVALDEISRAALVAELLATPTARAYLRVLRRHGAASSWRAVIDALRPASQRLWMALSESEQRRFLRHLFGLWNRHRHRAPPATFERVLRDRRLSLEKARWPMRVDPPAALVLDCRGFGLSSPRHSDPLLKSLQASGGLSPGPLGIGWVSRRPETLEVLGALRFGVEFESTAVPELRAQAAELVGRWGSPKR